MARPRSDERRTSILEAATRVISSQGLANTTISAIATNAGVSNGSLFIYFDTKTNLLNELFVQLKKDMGEAAFADFGSSLSPREQLRHVWMRWLTWATTHPEKRRALAQLELSEDIVAASHALVRESQREMAELLEQSRVGGPMADTPISFALVITGAIADATMDALIRDPIAPKGRSEAAFEALWRVLAG
jgi:AcrR family transcriptional regulator